MPESEHKCSDSDITDFLHVFNFRAYIGIRIFRSRHNSATYQCHRSTSAAILRNRRTLRNIELSTGVSTDAVARFGYLEDADLCQWNSTTHQYVANMQSNAINNGTEPLIIKLSLSKGTNNLGCFFSLEKITLKHTISQQTADEELAAYKVPIELSLTQLGFWDDITSVSNIVILEDTQDVMAALEMAKAEVKAAENALYASLDGKYMTFRKKYPCTARQSTRRIHISHPCQRKSPLCHNI